MLTNLIDKGFIYNPKDFFKQWREFKKLIPMEPSDFFFNQETNYTNPAILTPWGSFYLHPLPSPHPYKL